MINKKIDYNFFHWGPFLYKTTLNKKEIKEIRNLCSKNNKDVRDTLAGLIDHEYEVDTKKIFPIIAPYIQSYMQAYSEHYNRLLPPKIKLTSCWVNYMTKYESNPIHHHDGGDLSFVMFTGVPKKLKEEYNKTKSRSSPGTINFVYKLEKENFNINYHSFFPTVGDFFIFPADLNHYVNNFRSSGERISLSGNLNFNTLERNI